MHCFAEEGQSTCIQDEEKFCSGGVIPMRLSPSSALLGSDISQSPVSAGSQCSLFLTAILQAMQKFLLKHCLCAIVLNYHFDHGYSIFYS